MVALTPSLRVGLTGGIGSGKTTVSNLFAGLGVPIIDADRISHDLVRSGKPAYLKILREFGVDVAGEGGEMRRDHLRRIVFSEPENRRRLEAIIHPLVRLEIAQQAASAPYSYCIISIPLLFESGKGQSVDRVLVVDVSESTQLLRASLRDGVSEDSIKKIMDTQVSRAQRLAGADDVIQNDLGPEHLCRQVKKLHDKYLVIATNSLQ